MATSAEEMEENLDPDLGQEEIVDPPKVEGYMNYNQWIEAGKDPEKFRGRKAFEEHGESIKTIKELNQKFSKFGDTVNELKTRYETDANAKIEQARAEIQTELQQARDDEDVKAVEAARDKLDNLKPAPQSAPQPLNVIQEYFSKNPALDQNSDQFDSELYATWARTHDATLDRLLGGDRSKQGTLTAAEVEGSMNAAMDAAKTVYPHKFKSPRNSRSSAPNSQSRKPQSNQDYRSKLKSVITNSMNKNDTSGAVDMYDLILKKGSKEEADDYAKRVLGE
jgi:hypothetical protein